MELQGLGIAEGFSHSQRLFFYVPKMSFHQFQNRLQRFRVLQSPRLCSIRSKDQYVCRTISTVTAGCQYLHLITLNAWFMGDLSIFLERYIAFARDNVPSNTINQCFTTRQFQSFKAFSLQYCAIRFIYDIGHPFTNRRQLTMP
jgi:hypothetical protein